MPQTPQRVTVMALWYRWQNVLIKALITGACFGEIVTSVAVETLTTT